MAATTRYGLYMCDVADAWVAAHELGHVLNLDFHGGANIGHADDTSTAKHARDNIWIRRRLMFSYRHPSAAPGRRRDVGYGPQLTGAFIATKNMAGDPTDSEYAEIRTRATSALP